MRMSRSRKQTLLVRAEAEKTPVKEMVEDDRSHDPLLLQGSVMESPGGQVDMMSELLKDACATVLCDFSPSPTSTPYLSEDAANMTAFLDVIPDKLWDDPSSSLENSPANRVRREIFQDLRHTSTPKSRSPLADSGIQLSASRKRIRFTEDRVKDVSKETHNSMEGFSVLHDITSFHNTTNSFVNIMNNMSVDSDTSIGSQDRGGRCPPIIRGGRSRHQPHPPKRSKGEFASNHFTRQEQKKISYYTGISKYNWIESMFRQFELEEEGLSSVQVLILTLMKLRLDLEWKDLSYRFDVEVPTATRLFDQTLGVLAPALSDKLPWQNRASIFRKAPKFVYLHPVYFRDGALRQAIVCVTNDTRPVLFVSKPFGENHKPLKVLAESEFVTCLIPGDVLCCKGYASNDKSTTCFLVTNGHKTEELSDDSLYRSAIWESQRVVKRLCEFKMFKGCYQIKDLAMRRMLTVISAITNVNSETILSFSSP